ncbi:SDR family NAD(P)-dependent oxidoreductase [Pseudacidovorax intermedius]|uniref:SDR family NAD(P)-dependent oxidoreductase n=1 Tax=Pseudacidovorax intermedius TaxID=433924 RepID=UPI001FA7B28F|nr:SDR family NAD(P)-dependent oxidoreductase [Pseudacidovorax intermedius]
MCTARCHAVLPGVVARKGGRIVNIISEAGRIGEADMAVYSGAKAAIAGARTMCRAGGLPGLGPGAVHHLADHWRLGRIRDGLIAALRHCGTAALRLAWAAGRCCRRRPVRPRKAAALPRTAP